MLKERVKTRLHCYIVEDDRIAQIVNQSFIERLGHIVDGISDNYDDALSEIQSKQPDLIFMDIHLVGEKNGIDIARALRANKIQTPIIFVSGVSDDWMKECLSQDEHALEPCDRIFMPGTLEDVKQKIEALALPIRFRS